MKTGVDASRMASLASRPGIDPRIWCVTAVITELGFDAEQGIFADIQYTHDGTIETAAISSPYATDGAGLYCPYEIGDIVLVIVPMGDPNYGPAIVGKAWRKGTKPPPEAGEGDTPVDEPVWRIKDGKTLHILTKNGVVEIKATGSGEIHLKSEVKVIVDSPSVLLGPAPGAPIARVGDIVAVSIPPMLVGPGSAAGSIIVSPPNPPGGPILAVGQITSGQAGVKA